MKPTRLIALLPLLLWTGLGCKQTCLEQQAAAAVDITGGNDRTLSGWRALDSQTPTGLIQTVGSLSREGQLSVLLPLDLSTGQTRYALLLDGKPDTLTIRYGTDLRFVSQRCGYTVVLTRPAQGLAVRRVSGPVDSVFYGGEMTNRQPRFFAGQSAMLIKLNL